MLQEKIHDNRFLRLIAGLLKAGYLEDWKYHKTLSGSPQGGVISPILSNIYLDKLDKYIETTLLPTYNRGEHRKRNRIYNTLSRRVQRLKKRGEQQEALRQRRLMQQYPVGDPQDPAYRRLYYCRYADDWLLGFAGPKQEAEEIKQAIGTFLQNHLKLELSETKTLITHARTEKAKFLGYQIAVFQENRKLDRTKRRNINGGLYLLVPPETIQEHLRLYQRGGKPKARTERCNESVLSIIMRYQQTYRGLVEYYQLAHNRHRFQRLKWGMERSLTRTLARKLKTSTNQVYRQYKTYVETDQGRKPVIETRIERKGKPPLIARWGAISLERKERAILQDHLPQIWTGRTELVQRLLAQTCELCGSREQIQVHHIRALKDLHQDGRREKPERVKRMAALRRKTLIVCRKCHEDIHNGHPQRQQLRR